MVSTPNRIVVGIDHKTTMVLPSNGQPVGHSTATKIALLKGKFVVACIGMENMQGLRQTGEMFMAYDFTSWIKAIEMQITSETTTTALSEIVGKEGRRILTETLPFPDWMKSGAVKETDLTLGTIIQFNVVGFDNGVNTLVEIKYRLDWDDDSVIGPAFDVHPYSTAFKSGTYSAGVDFAIREYQNVRSYAHRRLRVLAPTAFANLMANRSLNEKESIRAARALIGIEADVEPNLVGAGATIIVLPLGAIGSVTEYDDLALPETESAKQKKAH
jgi:hypothetical protein